MAKELKIICYPDPRLRAQCAPVIRFDPVLKEVAAEMLRLMREHRGVGLAAPQVALNMRLFVMNPTGKDGDDRVYVNPVLTDEAKGEEEAEEGCLSIPGINAKIWRSKTITMNAQDLEGNRFEEKASGFVARVWQHETDHLNGELIIDKMRTVAKLAARRILKELRDKYEEGNK